MRSFARNTGAGHETLDVDLDVGAVIDLPRRKDRAERPAMVVRVDEATLKAVAAAPGVVTQLNSTKRGEHEVVLFGLCAGDVAIVCVGEAGDPDIKRLLQDASASGGVPVLLMAGDQIWFTHVGREGVLADLAERTADDEPPPPSEYARLMLDGVGAGLDMLQSLPEHMPVKRVLMRLVVSASRVQAASHATLPRSLH